LQRAKRGPEVFTNGQMTDVWFLDFLDSKCAAVRAAANIKCPLKQEGVEFYIEIGRRT
jgi:hypothetical protein